MADFNGFWTTFHQLFFTNDLWLLNPATDLMINLFPEAFFSHLVIRILLWFLCLLSALSDRGILQSSPEHPDVFLSTERRKKAKALMVLEMAVGM